MSRLPLPRWLRLASTRPLARSSLAALLAGLTAACGGGEGGDTEAREIGQSDFVSAAPASNGSRGGLASGPAAAGGDANQAPSGNVERKVEETDLYRLDGDRLYYLNAYRGLMVFDVSNVDAPQLLGRSPIYGAPIEMIVRDGVASVVVADWYGTMDDGTPFHGSIVRGIDARDPSNIRVLGEASLGGFVRDTRVVGDVIYAVTEHPSWLYGWYGRGDVAVGAVAGGASGSRVSVSSVSFAGGVIEHRDSYEAPGYGGVFYVTPNAILFASDVLGPVDQYGYAPPSGESELRYLDISSPTGEIEERGVLRFSGTVQNYAADGGRWNIDFADGKTAHVLSCSGSYCGSGSGALLSIADFSDPDGPELKSQTSIPATSWNPVARFDAGRMYLSPNASGCYSYDGGAVPTTPIQIYDLTDPTAPALAGSSEITGEVYLFVPSGDRLFALGSDCDAGDGRYYGSDVSLRYLDVTNPAAPALLGASEFGEGWAWTPAAGTFKAFTKDDAQGLVVLPFSGWSAENYAYNNGLQLIEFSDAGIATSGTAKTRGWVERGIFVKNRLVSLSNLALSVVDYSDRTNPVVVSELTLARNVVNVRPNGSSVAELSSDWWSYDQERSTLRVLPIEQAEENVSGAALAEVEIDGFNPRVFHNGNMAYVVSNVRREADCSEFGYTIEPGSTQKCYAWTQEVQVLDLSGSSAAPRGRIRLPEPPNGGSYYGGWGWFGCYYWDWYHGDDVVQVAGDALAFRRWQPIYENGSYVDSLQSLFIVDASDPNAPSVGSAVITSDSNGWWGNMRAFGDDLYVTHYEWVEQPSYAGNVYYPGLVRYYADKIDLSDRARPRIAARMNVPGMLVGASETDPSLIYTMDYRWYGDHSENELAVLRVQGDRAYLEGRVTIPGWVGNTFVRGNTAYFSVQHYGATTAQQQLFQVDLSNPNNPVVLPSAAEEGWGWLLGVEGDRAIVTSGWGNGGVDIFKLSPDAPPAFEQFVRTRGWWASSLGRQDHRLFLASGYWGTQTIDLTSP